MANLRRICCDLGFSDCSTYLASGNAIFETDLGPEDAAQRLDKALGAHMGKCPGVLVRNPAQMRDFVEGLPFGGAPGARVAVLFSSRPAEAAQLGEWKNRTREKIAIHADHLVIHFPEGMGASKLNGPAFDHGTMRNRNTVVALAERLRA